MQATALLNFGQTAQSRSLSRTLAHFALDLSLTDLPQTVVTKTKLLLLDTVGVCVGSAAFPSGRAILDQCALWSGTGDCTLIGDPRLVSPQYAAFGNGALGHGQDFDDTHTESIVHPSCVLVPAALTATERHDRSGTELLANLAGATEAVIRMALPAGGAINRRGFQASSSLGALGSALIVIRAAGMDEDRAVHAVGIAGSFASGLMECVPAAASSKQFQPGWGGFCGVMAADLAVAGFTGPQTVLEGSLGYYAAFLHGLPIAVDDVTAGLGSTWEILNVRPKLYPCAHNVHAAIECAAALRAEYGFSPDQIVSVLCEPPQGSVAMVCEPWEKKVAPATGYDARFSLAYAIAVMLVTGQAGAQSFTDELATDQVVRSVMQRTRYRVNPQFIFKDMPGRVTVELDNGAVHTHEIPFVRGNAAAPIGEHELLAKFMTNTAALGPERGQRVADMIMDVEHLPSVRTLMAELRPA